jgi:hypothetical protein
MYLLDLSSVLLHEGSEVPATKMSPYMTHNESSNLMNADLSISPRWGHSAFHLDSQLYIFG